MGKRKGKSARDIVAEVNAALGAGLVRYMGGKYAKASDCVSSGSLALDHALGGGYPRGRIIEIFGPEQSGKTTLALHAVANVQREGGTAGFVDAEHALDPAYAGRIGTKTDELIISQPDYGEQALTVIEQLVRANLGVVVVDSVAALVPKAEIDGDFGASHMGLHARLMSQAMRKLTGAISKSNTLVIFINQTRKNLSGYGASNVTTGGNALKFYASQRLDVRRDDWVKQGDNMPPHAIRARVRVAKNKVGLPFRTAIVTIMLGQGISAGYDLLEMGEQLAVIERSGSWYSYDGARLANGRLNTVRAIDADAALQADIREAVKSAMEGV